MLYRIIGTVLLCALANQILRMWRPELAPLLSVVCACIVASVLLPDLVRLYGELEDCAALTENGGELFKLMGKTVLSACLAQFAADLCVDAGERALAGKILFAARVEILLLSLPMLSRILGLLASLLSGV